MLLNVAGARRVLVNSLTRLNARLTDGFALSVGFQLSFDSTPALNKKPTDTVLSTGVELTF